MNNNVRVRFAPSPTGHLHIGSVRVALFNWLFARHNGGKYLLRVEDTDTMRSTQEYTDALFDMLSWFGMQHDENPVYQKARADEHRRVAQELVRQGKAYPCFCPPKDAEDRVNDLEQGIGSKYDGTCRNRPFTEEDLKKPHAIRFKLPENIQSVSFDDMVLGPINVEAKELDDYIIIRRDGMPVYNFCVVVDDIFMNISHVIRGQDHISNTPKQILYYQALDAQIPQFAHIPLILSPTGAKLSKRDAAVAVAEYKAQGYLPEALRNYLVRLGWSHGDQEVFTNEELISFFSFDHVGKKGSIFDLAKLQWLNSFYIRQTPAARILELLEQIDKEYTTNLEKAWDQKALIALIDQYKQRAVTLIEIYKNIVALALPPETYDLTLIEKWRFTKTKDLISSFLDAVAHMQTLDHDTLLAKANEGCTHCGAKLVQLAQPLRLALTGGIVSPGVFELIAIMGREKTIARLEIFLKNL